MTEPSLPRLADAQRANVLAEAQRLRDAGQRDQARALLRVVLSRYPGDVPLWLALAPLAETREASRAVLQTALGIEPGNALALRGLAVLDGVPDQRPKTEDQRPHGSDDEPQQLNDPAVRRPPSAVFPPTLSRSERTLRNALLYTTGALATAALVITLIRLGERQTRTLPPETNQAIPAAAADPFAATLLPETLDPTAIPASTNVPTAAPPTTLPTTTVPPTTLPTTTVPPTTAPPTAVPATSAPPTAVPATLIPTPSGLLRPGRIIERNDWQLTLLRADHARPLAGAVGTLQPQGRFFVVLLTVGRIGASAPLPLGELVLVDEVGARYRPIPGASRAYLDTYGRGEFGDLSDDQPIAQGANVSVPLLFDIAPEAVPQRFLFGDTGWLLPRVAP